MLDEIIKKYELIITEMPHKRKYYHLNSIRNFIIHYNEFGTIYYKKQVAELLITYLDFAINKHSIEQNEAKDIFYEYINPIGMIYLKRQNFRFYMQPSTIILWVGLSFIFYFLFNFSYIIYLLTFFIGVIIFIPKYLNYKKNKVFGFDF